MSIRQTSRISDTKTHKLDQIACNSVDELEGATLMKCATVAAVSLLAHLAVQLAGLPGDFWSLKILIRHRWLLMVLMQADVTRHFQSAVFSRGTVCSQLAASTSGEHGDCFVLVPQKKGP